MNKDDVTRWAREAGLKLIEDCCDVPDKFCGQDVWKGNLHVFAKLIAAAEREACAKVVEEPWQGSPKEIAAAIRARNKS